MLVGTSHLWLECIHDRQSNNNVTLARSRNYCCSGNTTMHSVCCSVACHCQPHKNIKYCTTMLLWKIYVAGSNKTDIGFCVKCLMLHYNKPNDRMLLAFFRHTVGRTYRNDWVRRCVVSHCCRKTFCKIKRN